jgi:hypothetical protein
MKVTFNFEEDQNMIPQLFHIQQLINSNLITEEVGFRELVRYQIKNYLQKGLVADADYVNRFMRDYEKNNTEYIEDLFNILMKTKNTKFISAYPDIVALKGKNIKQIQSDLVGTPKMNKMEAKIFANFEEAIVTPTSTKLEKAGHALFDRFFDPTHSDYKEMRDGCSVEFFKYILDKIIVNGKFFEGFVRNTYRGDYCKGSKTKIKQSTKLKGQDKGDTLHNQYYICKLIREKVIALSHIKRKNIVNLVNFDAHFQRSLEQSRGIADQGRYPSRAASAIDEIFNKEFYDHANMRALYMELKLSNKK